LWPQLALKFREVVEDSKGYLRVNRDPIMWTMLNAIKDQLKQIEDLKTENTAMNAKVTEIETNQDERQLVQQLL